MHKINVYKFNVNYDMLKACVCQTKNNHCPSKNLLDKVFLLASVQEKAYQMNNIRKPLVFVR